MTFETVDLNGNKVSLDDFKGKYVVLYFYPKDNTAGCTTEAIEFNELIDEFSKLDTVVFGISKDSEKSHHKFTEKNELKFPLLMDEEKKLHEEFDVLKPKKMYGKEYIGTQRSTFIFDKEGNLIKEYRKVKAKGHAKEVLDFIESLN